MRRKWAVFENIGDKCVCYAQVLLGDRRLFSDEKDEVFILCLNEAYLKSQLNASDVKRLGIVQVDCVDDLERFFCDPKDFLVILDINIDDDIQTFRDFGDCTSRINKMWHRVHAHERNLIVISTMEGPAKQAIEEFKAKDPKRFVASEGFYLHPPEEKEENLKEARQVLEYAHSQWLKVYDPSRELLRAIVEAQSFGSDEPAHPESWDEVPEGFPFKECFQDDPYELRCESFKALFCLKEVNKQDQDKKTEQYIIPDQDAPAYYQPSRRLRLLTLRNILQSCELPIKVTHETGEDLALPGGAGAFFLWRFLNFVKSLNPPRPDPVTLDFNGEVARLTLQLSDIRHLWAATITRAEGDGGATTAFRRLLVCAPPEQRVFEKAQIPGGGVVLGYRLNYRREGRELDYPAVWPEWHMKSETLSFRWKY